MSKKTFLKLILIIITINQINSPTNEQLQNKINNINLVIKKLMNIKKEQNIQSSIQCFQQIILENLFQDLLNTQNNSTIFEKLPNDFSHQLIDYANKEIEKTKLQIIANIMHKKTPCIQLKTND